jgi:hypothetical protein
MLCKVGGLLLLVAGVAGFFLPNLLGMHLTTTHNVIHVFSGLLSLFCGFVAGGARLFCAGFGLSYIALAVLGFVAPAVVASLLGHAGAVDASHLMPDNLVHMVLGVAFLAAGLVRESVGYQERTRHPVR